MIYGDYTVMYGSVADGKNGGVGERRMHRFENRWHGGRMRVWHVRETGGCERLDAFALAVDKVAVVLFAVGVGEGALAMHLALLHRAGVEHRAGGSSTTYRARQAEHACARERRSLGKRRKACKGRAKQMYVRCVRCL